jgi:hypothetical protein
MQIRRFGRARLNNQTRKDSELIFEVEVIRVRNKLIITILSILLITSSSLLADEPSKFELTNGNVEPGNVSPLGKVLISCHVSHPLGPMHIENVAASVYHGGWITTHPVLYDDGTHGDVTPDDGIYSLEIKAATTPCEAKIVFHASDKDRNEIESEPVILVVK